MIAAGILITVGALMALGIWLDGSDRIDRAIDDYDRDAAARSDR